MRIPGKGSFSRYYVARSQKEALSSWATFEEAVRSYYNLSEEEKKEVIGIVEVSTEVYHNSHDIKEIWEPFEGGGAGEVIAVFKSRPDDLPVNFELAHDDLDYIIGAMVTVNIPAIVNRVALVQHRGSPSDEITVYCPVSIRDATAIKSILIKLFKTLGFGDNFPQIIWPPEVKF